MPFSWLRADRASPRQIQCCSRKKISRLAPTGPQRLALVSQGIDRFHACRGCRPQADEKRGMQLMAWTSR